MSNTAMFYFISITFKNFYSFGNSLTTIDLTVKDPTLILGKNISDATTNGIDSNGAGKTTIINAICYALYGKTIDGNEKSGIINYINNKDLEVSILFKKGLLYYKIIQFRKNKAFGGNGVRFYHASTLAELEMKEGSLDSVNDDATTGTINEQIMEVLNMPFSVFSRVILFSAQDEPFLNLTAALQRQIIENLCNMDEISLRSKELKIKKDKAQIELNIEIKLYEQIRLQQEAVSQQIHNVESKILKWKNDHITRVKLISDKILDFSSMDIEKSKTSLVILHNNKSNLSLLYPEQKNRTNEYTRLQNNIEKYSTWNISHGKELLKLNNRINDHIAWSVLDQQSILVNSKKEALDERHNIEMCVAEDTDTKKLLDVALFTAHNELTHLLDSKCPYCLQHYSNKVKVEEIKKEIIDNTDTLKTLELNLLNVDSNLAKVNKSISEIDELLRFKSIHEITKIIDNQQIDIDKLNSLKLEKNPYDELDEVSVKNALIKLRNELKIINDKICDLTNETKIIEESLQIKTLDEVENIESTLLKLSTELNSINNDNNPHIETLEELKKITTEPSDLKINKLKKLIYHQEFLYKLLTRKDSMLRKILLSGSLPYLNGRLEIYLNNLGLPHKVAFTDDMGTIITKHGTLIKYKGLSSGQKARINIALAFAFRDLLQKRHGKTSLFLLDECLDHGLGNIGIELAAKLVKEKAIADNVTMMIITHKDEITDIFPRKLVVIHENEFSRIEYPL